MANKGDVSELSENVVACKNLMPELADALENIAMDQDNSQRNLDIAKVSLGSTGLAGGIMTVVGLALAPVTFGASLGLAIAGGVIGGGSAIGNISAIVVDKKLSQQNLEKAQKLLNDFAQRSKAIQDRLKKLVETLNERERVFAQSEIEKSSLLDKDMKKRLIDMLEGSQWIRVTVQMNVVEPVAKEAVKQIIYACQLLMKAGKASKALGSMATGAKAAAGLANTGKSIGTAADLGTDAAATTGKVAASGVKVAGIALACVGIALDLGAVIYYSQKIHKNNPSAIATKIRSVAECLK